MEDHNLTEKPHRHLSALRGTKVLPRRLPISEYYTELHERYAGQTGTIHDVLPVAGQELAKVGFPDRKIVYYLLQDLEQLPKAPKEEKKPCVEG